MKVDELFDIKYGINLELINCEITTQNDPEGVAFVARTSENNGIVAYVKKIEGKTPQPAGVITCAAGGSVLSTFVQVRPFYSGRDLYVLYPKENMTLNEKLFYCMCIQKNAYRYSYGRQANKSLKDIEIPANIPSWVNEVDCSPVSTRINRQSDLSTNTWQEFILSDLFTFVKGKRLTKADMVPGNINFIGAISENNGVREHIDTSEVNAPNCITVNYNGSVGEAFYQEKPFWASDDVNILYPKNWKMNKYSALFIITVIKANRFRFSYGRKWTLDKMKQSIIKLPITESRNPDYEYMERYVKSLPFSDRI